jgi:CO/xanthine dehydrogenase FAD-binding subunit
MDVATVTDILRPTARDQLPQWRQGDAWLGGGTWLFSDPPRDLTRLIDLDGFAWTPLVRGGDGLTIAATCRIAELYSFTPPEDWPAAAALFRPCCKALQSSFKIWNTATVGGNLCLSLPAGTLIALLVALDAECLIWRPDGSERRVKAVDFVTDINRNLLVPGELLREVLLPVVALRRPSVFRHATSRPFRRSIALLIGSRSRADSGFSLTIGAATRRPVRLELADVPEATDLRAAIERSVPASLYVDDEHATASHRRRMTLALAEEVRLALAGEIRECR